jgi:hypothetical protein
MSLMCSDVVTTHGDGERMKKKKSKLALRSETVVVLHDLQLRGRVVGGYITNTWDSCGAGCTDEMGGCVPVTAQWTTCA